MRYLLKILLLLAALITACGGDTAPEVGKDGRAVATTQTTKPSPSMASASQIDDLAISCNFDEAHRQVTCEASGYTEGARLYWWTNSEQAEGEGANFTFRITQERPDLSIMFEECEDGACQTLTTHLDISDMKNVGVSAQESPKTPQGTEQSIGLIDPAPDFTPQTVYVAFPADMQSKFEQSVDQAFNSATDKAGISVGVYQGGRLWSYAMGTASESVPMRAETPMLIRSVSKTFIAALILSQVEDGLYKLSDTISSVLSDHPDYGEIDTDFINPDVTVSQLLSMTAGLADYGENKGSDYSAVLASAAWKPADLPRLVSSPHTSPGEYAYSNTNTALLGMIAEHQGGLPLNRLLKQEFFDPLGISAALLPQDGTPADTARPHGDREQWGGVGFGDISESSSGWRQDWFLQTNRTTWIGGGIVTTAGNLAHWGYELFSEGGSAIAPKVRETLLDSFVGESVRIGGTLQQYGFHVTKSTLELEDGSNLVMYGHPGSGGGFTALLLYSPQLDLSITVLANSHSDVRRGGPENTALSAATFHTIMRAISLAYLQEKGAATALVASQKDDSKTESERRPDPEQTTPDTARFNGNACITDSDPQLVFTHEMVPLEDTRHTAPPGSV